MRYLTGSGACARLAETRRDVLRAIQAGASRALDLGFVARREAPRQIGLVLLSQFRERVDLETPTIRLVYQRECGTAVEPTLPTLVCCASAPASITVVEAYRHVMWTAAVASAH